MLDENPENTYTELGRFVEAFELMVDSLRSGLILILSNPSPKWQPLVRIPFHHGAMTAKPLAEIFAAVLATILNDPETLAVLKLDDIDLKTYKGVLAQTAADCQKVANKRNNLLHSTWYVGQTADPPDLSSFSVEKLTTSGSGLEPVNSLPRDIDELKALTQECLRLRSFIQLLYAIWGFASTPNPIKISTLFTYNSETKRWVRVTTPPSAEKPR